MKSTLDIPVAISAGAAAADGIEFSPDPPAPGRAQSPFVISSIIYCFFHDVDYIDIITFPGR